MFWFAVWLRRVPWILGYVGMGVSPVRGVSASVNQQAQLGSDTRWLRAWLQWKQGSWVCKEEENQRISGGLDNWVCACVRARPCLSAYFVTMISCCRRMKEVMWHRPAQNFSWKARIRGEPASHPSSTFINFPKRFLCNFIPDKRGRLQGESWIHCANGFQSDWTREHFNIRRNFSLL